MPRDAIIEELRRDPAPQLAAQAALEAVRAEWRSRPDVLTLTDELGSYGEGAPLGECPSLGRLVTQFEVATEFAQGFVALHGACLRQNPLGHLPFRHQYSSGIAVIQLATAGPAALSLITYEARGNAPAQTVCFAGGERHELCLAGKADIRLVTRRDGGGLGSSLAVEHREIGAGDTMTLADPDTAKLVDRPHPSLTILRLSRSDADPAPAREYRIADGALVHVASSKRGESAAEMALAVLGAMGRRDTAPAFAEVIRSKASAHLRWEALRQVLALDAAAGFHLLTDVARDHADPLAVPAGALRATLIEAHPALAEVAT